MNSNIKANRINYIDAAKGIGILAVMYGHITSLGNPIDRWLSTFKLGIFFIISGWLICHKNNIKNIPFKDFVKRKFNTLLIPYFTFSIIVILYRIMVKVFKNASIGHLLNITFNNVYTTVSMRGISALWFLTALFFAEIIFYFIIRQKNSFKIIAAMASLVFSLLISMFLDYLKPVMSEEYITILGKNIMSLFDLVSMPILAVSKGITGFLLMLCGYFACLSIGKMTNKYKKLVLGIILSLLNIIFLRFNSGTIDLNNMHFGNIPILYFLCNICASLGLLLILEFFEQYTSYEFLSWCGRNSLIIMATHGTLGFKAVFVKGWAGVVSLSDTVCLKYYIECLMILIHLIVFEYGIVSLINYKLPFLLGKSSAGASNLTKKKKC